MESASTSNDQFIGSTKGSFSKLLINRKRQDGNPVLKYIRNVPYEWSDIKADFECGKGCGILYLGLKYHKLHPGYIETRFPDGNGYTIKILLALVNVEEPSFLLRDLNMFCYRAGWTMLLCYSVEEAAEYIENLKLAETRNPMTTINNRAQYKQKQQMAHVGKKSNANTEQQKQLYESAIKFLTSVRAVTNADAKRLLGTFGSICEIANATKEDLEMCPGLGPIKAQNVFNSFRSPFTV
uniref:ERCC1-like central domain-containing protein n=1 Tax=Acrobeloides nanus TaxID=290746 RepID=A0A914DQC7_9BILA